MVPRGVHTARGARSIAPEGGRSDDGAPKPVPFRGPDEIPMEPTQVTGDADLETAFAAPVFLLFKHSLTCPTSAMGFAQYKAFLAEHPDTPTAWIDVIGQRPLSLGVAERTGVIHESPQALVIRNGEVTWHASHGAITKASLAEAVA